MLQTRFYFKVIFTAFVLSAQCIAAEPETRIVNSTSNDPNTVGTLPYWLLNANDGDTIDCGFIAGQTITLTSSLPAIANSYTINGGKSLKSYGSAFFLRRFTLKKCAAITF